MTLQFTTEAHYSAREELKNRLERAQQEGLVDCKAEIDVHNHSSTRDLLSVLNNLLRLREEGPKATIVID